MRLGHSKYPATKPQQVGITDHKEEVVARWEEELEDEEEESEMASEDIYVEDDPKL